MSDLTAKQEAFCRAYIETGNASEAYRRSYDVGADTKPETVWQEASRMMADPKVGARVEALFEELRVMEVGRNEAFGARLAFTLPPVPLKNETVLPMLNDYEARPYGSSWQVFKAGSAEPVMAADGYGHLYRLKRLDHAERGGDRC